MARLGGVWRMQQRRALGEIGYGPEITLRERERERERRIERMGEADKADEIDM